MENENQQLQDILKSALSKIPEGNFSQMANNLKLNEQNLDLNSVLGSGNPPLQDILNTALNKIPEGNFSQMADNLKSNEQNLDLNSIMGLASKLLSNEAVMSSLQGLGKGNPLHTLPTAHPQPKQENQELSALKESITQLQSSMAEWTSLREQYTDLLNELRSLKFELIELRSTIQLFSSSEKKKNKKKD